MGDDMFIIAYEQAVIMHDQRHIHVIMNIIVNPRWRGKQLFSSNVTELLPHFLVAPSNLNMLIWTLVN